MLKLSQIAAGMYMQAKLHPDPTTEQMNALTRSLDRGLCLNLTIRHGDYTMFMWRTNVPPSAVEEKIIAEQFGVPKDAQRTIIVQDDKKAIKFTWPTPTDN
jgi:hypothetical protein